MAQLLGKPAALFLPSGTLAQAIALRVHADQRGKRGVALHPTSHLVIHEQDGYQQLWGLRGHEIGVADKVLEAADLPSRPAEDLAALLIELPMREIGGQLPSWEDLNQQIEWARQHQLAVHIDGARLWHCPAYYGVSLARISALADSVYVSLYKDIGGIAGAILAADTKLIAQAKLWNRRAGGNLIAFYPYLLAAEQGLEDNLACMEDAVNYARQLGPLLATIPGVECVPAQPQAAMFHLHITADRESLEQALMNYQKEHDVETLPKPRALDASGRCVCEISVGRNTLKHPADFWTRHLHALLTTYLQ